MVGKGAPDRGGIPTFLETLLHSRLAQDHDLRFLNVAHTGIPEGGRPRSGNLRRTLLDAVAVWRRAAGCDVVHIHSALAPTVTVLRAALLALAGPRPWLRRRRARARRQHPVLADHAAAPVAPAPGHAARRTGWSPCWTAGGSALRQVLPAERVTLIDNGVPVDGYSRAGGRPRTTADPVRGSADAAQGRPRPARGVAAAAGARGVRTRRGCSAAPPTRAPAAEAEVRAALDGSAKLLGTRAPEEMPGEFAARGRVLPAVLVGGDAAVGAGGHGGRPARRGDRRRRRGTRDRRRRDRSTWCRCGTRRSSPTRWSACSSTLRSASADGCRGAERRVVEKFSGEVTAASVSALYDELAAYGPADAGEEPVTILCYHSVEPDWESPLAVDPEAFARQAEWLRRSRHVLPLGDAVRRLDARGRLPRGAVALTFDDGFAALHAVRAAGAHAREAAGHGVPRRADPHAAGQAGRLGGRPRGPRP